MSQQQKDKIKNIHILNLFTKSASKPLLECYHQQMQGTCEQNQINLEDSQHGMCENKRDPLSRDHAEFSQTAAWVL